MVGVFFFEGGGRKETAFLFGLPPLVVAFLSPLKKKKNTNPARKKFVMRDERIGTRDGAKSDLWPCISPLSKFIQKKKKNLC